MPTQARRAVLMGKKLLAVAALALIIALYRIRRTVNLEEMDLLKG